MSTWRHFLILDTELLFSGSADRGGSVTTSNSNYESDMPLTRYLSTVDLLLELSIAISQSILEDGDGPVE